MKLILALIMAVLGPAYAGGDSKYPNQPPTSVAYSVLEYACTALERDCAELRPPFVVYLPLLGTAGHLGQYWPEQNIIALDVSFIGTYDHYYTQATYLHEIVHFVDWFTAPEAYGGELCATEANAWRTENMWLVASGHWADADWSWRGRYGC